MMPLMFVISGASLFYALGKGGFGKFLTDKVLRLLVPLFVGALTHLSLQSYLWDKTHGLFSRKRPQSNPLRGAPRKQPEIHIPFIPFFNHRLYHSVDDLR
jgi:hypothetical protein